ncbi:molybdopterin molybdotransferase MoeA [Arcticibacter tournemirensis]|uniref:Molybdopterin molybdenumtransferase n=1 Tax=Arcticibacter tournemirensis TaxID=699437 RepID=A0A5M9HHE2_9SPHI|nr:molybdopterin molybdotransferase MoeA [Arcticibacter tournemirensis]KAA8485865.1 molybdopterin molybdotransferase MoeA [Arcticibacter tournemirensis]
MISVQEALEKIESFKKDFGTEEVSLSDALHRILAEDIQADRDFPPYDRVTMDGIAINVTSFEQGRRSFALEKIQAAGDRVQVLDDPHKCIEVMTGAVLPQSTDGVIPYEDILIGEGKAFIKADTVRKFQNVHLRGTDSKAGSLLIEKGVRINASHIGVLASTGKNKVVVKRTPTVAVCSTGDELVDVEATPEPFQVRRSNVHMIASALMTEGIRAEVFHFPDDKFILTDGLKAIVKQFDVLLLSGAVSKGKFDFLPEVLLSLGLNTVFHRVAQKPGKPILFGSFESGKLVFGFPGNPVSTFVCYHLYFRYWLCQSLETPVVYVPVRLAEPVAFKPRLSYHLMVSLRNIAGVLEAVPVTGSGSGDLTGLVKAEGFVTLPAEEDVFEAGKLLWMIPFYS